MNDELPKTLHEAVRYFAEGDNALNFMRRLRWPDGKAKCPRCNTENNCFMDKRKVWQCRDCRKQFTVKLGTIMEDSPIALDKWICAMWMIANAKNGISSYELHRSLGMTQKTAWFVLHRIRLAMQAGSFEKMSGHVEADETFIGGKARFMHKERKEKRKQGRGPIAMTPVQGLLERSTRDSVSRVKLRILASTKKEEVQKDVRKYVLKGSEVHTDALRSYQGLNDEFTHNVVDHAQRYVDGHIHTNGLENFWSLLKRMIKGTYVYCEPFHLFRYLDEQAFRFNERKDDDQGRFFKVVGGTVGKRLTYSQLIGTGSETLTA